jgi:competence protein ComEA
MTEAKVDEDEFTNPKFSTKGNEMNNRNMGIFLLLIGMAMPTLAARAKAAPNAKANASSSSSTPATGVVNLNAASAEQISLLPRVGIKVAQRIVAYRKSNGDFKRVEDVMEVKGVGEKLFVVLRPHLATSGATTLAAKIKSTGMRKGRTKAAKTA